MYCLSVIILNVTSQEICVHKHREGFWAAHQIGKEQEEILCKCDIKKVE